MPDEITPEQKQAAEQQKHIEQSPLLKRLMAKKQEESVATEKKPDAEKPKDPVKEPKVPQGKKPEVEPEEEQDAEKEEQKKPSRRRRPEIDPTALAETVAASATKAAVEAMQSQRREDAKPTKEAPIELPEEFKEDEEIYNELAARDPKKYGDIKKRLAEAHRKEQEYIAKWQEDHPDEDFDPDAQEHENFFTRNEVSVSKGDLRAAERSVIRRQVSEEAKEEIKKVSQPIEESRTRSELAPVVQGHVDSVLLSAIKEIDPSYEEYTTSREKLNELGQKDPLLEDVLMEVLPQASKMIEETYLIGSGKVEFNPKKPMHSQFKDTVEDMEQRITSLPPRDRVFVGQDGVPRIFATWSQYESMSPQERSRHWVLTPSDIAGFIEKTAIEEAKTRYSKTKDKLKRYFGDQGAASKIPNHEQQRKPQQDQQQQAPERGSSTPVAMPGRGGVAVGAATPSSQKPSGMQIFRNRLAGG